MVKRLLLLPLALLLAATLPAGAEGRSRIVDLPVELEVVNANRSGTPCEADGARYALGGHLVGPRSALSGGGERVVTVYTNGFNIGGLSQWHLTTLPRYDLATRMARRGHVSFVYDRLGYDSSGFPDGFESCQGSIADVAHQIIAAMRTGSYELGAAASGRGTRGVAFDTVALAGHDSGGTAAEVEAYSFADTDALAVMSYADTGFTPTVTGWTIDAGDECSRGGRPARPGGPGGYFQLGPDSETIAPLVFPNAEPRVIEEIVRRRRLNPCGELASVPSAVATNLARLGEVRTPVLIIGGDTDVGFSEDGMRRQAGLFSGSDDVTVEILESTGHFPWLERTAPRFRRALSEWLRTRGLVSEGALTWQGCPAQGAPIGGSAGPDRLRGSGADESLIGRGGADLLHARGGSDCVRGGTGRDRLRAGGGDDVVYARDGRGDSVRCGRGNDRAEVDRRDRVRGCERIG